VTEAVIESIDHEGIGVAHDGKVTFLDGGVTGERVEFARRAAAATSTWAPSRTCRAKARSAPRRAAATRRLRRLRDAAHRCRGQVAAKQRVLEDNLARIGGPPRSILPPSWDPRAYRNRARLSVHYVAKRAACWGFHERRSSFVADTMSCECCRPRYRA
jgi:23S rRNA (uracil1939-C5)-methyltransferase